MASAGVARRASSRRGTAVIVVVGSLALIAVAGALYITIGQADQRTADSVERVRSTAGVEGTVARYVAGVVGDDRLDVSVTRLDRDDQGFVREAIDLPWADFQVRSVFGFGGFNSNNDLDQLRFEPSGLHRARYTNQGDIDADARVSSDPWLAASEPSWVGFDPFAPASDRDGRLFSGGDATELYWLDHRDWFKISNLAPDGRFVNLYNLRNNFAAEPGFGPADEDNAELAEPENRTSDLLSLLTFETNGELRTTFDLPFGIGDDVQNDDVRNTPAWFTMYQRGMLFPIREPYTVLDDDGQPTTWASPYFPDYQYADADGDGLADSRWKELVDATDQDSPEWLLPPGEFRWFIATRIVDLSARVNMNLATDQLAAPTSEVSPGTTPAEIDLRRLLALEDPAELYAVPVGSEVSAAVGERLSPRFFELPVGVDGNGDPVRDNADEAEPAPGVVGDLRAYRLAFGLGVAPGGTLDGGLNAARGHAAGWYAYDGLMRTLHGDFEWPAAGRFDVGDLGPAISNRNADGIAATSPGDQVRDERLFDLSPFEPEYRLVENADARESFEVSDPVAGPGTISAEALYFDRFDDENVFRDSAIARADWWHVRRADADTGGRRSSLGVLDTTSDGPGIGRVFFGVEDLAELLTFEGINDDSTVSGLEAALSGRYRRDGSTAAPNPSDFNGLELTPLFSTRPTDLDRFFHDDSESAMSPPFDTAWSVDEAGDGVMDAETLALKAVSPRPRLTTISGAVPLRRRLVIGAGGGITLDTGTLDLTDQDLRRPAVQYPNPFTGDFGDGTGETEPRTRLITSFIERAERLLPGLYSGGSPVLGENGFITDSWRDLGGLAGIDAGGPNETQSLFYGHAGPELALRLAAHAQLNELGRRLDVSLPAAVIVDSSARDQTGLSDAVSEATTPEWPWHAWAGGLVDAMGTATNRFDLNDVGLNDSLADPNDRAVLADNQITQEHRAAFTAFGVQPNPVITEVAVWNVWADAGENPAATSVAGLIEPSEQPPGGMPGAVVPGPVDIDLSVDATNEDLMLHLLIVQLHNPFDEPVELGGTTTTTSAETTLVDYYLEYNGRFFAMADVIEADSDTFTLAAQPSIPPGESVNVVVSLLPLPLVDDDGVDTFDRRWERADDIGDGQPGTPQELPVRAIIESRLEVDGRGGSVLYGTEIDPGSSGTLMSLRRESTSLDRSLLDRPANSIRPAGFETNREFRLWRSVVYAQALDSDNEIGAIGSGMNDGEPRTAEEGAVWWQNDQLVDRLRDPLVEGAGGDAQLGTTSFDVAFPDDSSDASIGGSAATLAGAPILAPDDRGRTVSSWAVVRRRDLDPLGTPADGAGLIAPWLLESPTGTTSEDDAEPATRTAIESNGSYTTTSTSFNETFREWRQALQGSPQLGVGTTRVNPGDPLRRSGVAVLGGGTSAAASIDAADVVNPLARIGVSVLPGERDAFEVLDIATQSDTLRNTSRVRLLDAIDTLAIGPTYTPGVSVTDSTEMLEWHWTTLGEALAAAVGALPPEYYGDGGTINFGNPGGTQYAEPDLYTPLRELWYNPSVADSAAPDLWVSRLDGVGLRTDRYPAFVNESPVAVEALAPVFLPGDDLLIGDGLPVALAAAAESTTLPIGPAGRPYDVEQGAFSNSDTLTDKALTTPIPGLINLNTASPIVMRLLPGLAPSLRVDPRGDSTWWPQRLIDTEVVDANNDEVDGNGGFGIPDPFETFSGSFTGLAFFNLPDVAVSMIAYRDRMEATPRPLSLADPASRNGGLPPVTQTGVNEDATRPTAMDFRPESSKGSPRPLRDIIESNFVDDRGRDQVHGITGARSAPGFSSVAEAAAVRLMPADTAAERAITNNAEPEEWDYFGFEGAAQHRHLSIDFYGRDFEEADAVTDQNGARNPDNQLAAAAPKHDNGQDFEWSFAPTGDVRLQQSGFPNTNERRATLDEIPNDQLEDLLIANGLGNVADVRSDYYAAWFVLRGYREADVQGLGEEDPMIPTIERRFLMIIDRSNVLRWGQQPRILLFREVPL